VKSSVPSKRSPAENARIGLLGRALQVGALSVAIAALVGMVLAAVGGLFLEAAIFGGASIPALWFSWQNPRTQPESLSRRLSYTRDRDLETPSNKR
jgi:hypothetical protein